MMQIKTCLKPGQKGTKKWLDVYGDRLVSVRYRYDAEKGRRYTTIEIIAEEGDWRPAKENTPSSRSMTEMLGIRVVGYELELREQVKKAGGIWRPRQKLWELPYGQIMALGLEDRIVDDHG
jgi:hypothetical protein